MSRLLRTLPLLAALIAAPSLAATQHHAHRHAHHRAAAKPQGEARASQGCPMMKGQMMGGAAGSQAMGPGGMMTDGKAHCMNGEAKSPPATTPPAPDQSHEHH